MKIECPHCGREGRLRDDLLTVPPSVRCPSCKQRFSPNLSPRPVPAGGGFDPDEFDFKIGPTVPSDSDSDSDSDPDVPYQLEDDSSTQTPAQTGASRPQATTFHPSASWGQGVSTPTRSATKASPSPPGPQPQGQAIRMGPEPRIYRWVEAWARGMILSTILFFISGLCYLVSSLCFAYDHLTRLREYCGQFPELRADELKRGEALFKITRDLLVGELGATALGALVLLIFCGCALILVDIGRMYRRSLTHVLNSLPN